MAKVQIFVLVVALSQVYGSVVIQTLPGVLDVPSVGTRPELLPEAGTRPEILPESETIVPDTITPPCVASIRAILEAILNRLPEIQAPAPLPVDPELLPQTPEQHPEEIPEEVPEVESEVEEEEESPVLDNPCTACFQHINTLLVTAEKVIAVRKMSQMLRI